MNNMLRVGIIDIGSNSIRLVIYETNKSDSYRVIDEAKHAARLSQYIDREGNIPREALEAVGETLRYFKQLCDAAGVTEIHAVATAAIRNANDSSAILELFKQRSGLDVRILSGEQEAHYGFLGLVNTMDITSGYLIDIGGGSTEITLIVDRTVADSFSFPYGAVQLAKQYGSDEEDQLNQLESKIRSLLERAADKHPWIRSRPGLPMYGLGGTVRALANIHMKQVQYSLPLTHHYKMSEHDVEELIGQVAAVPSEDRKQIEGLSKSRADIIIPGSLILKTFFRLCRCTHYIVSASGLRDGLFFKEILQTELGPSEILEHSVRNLINLHPTVPLRHVNQVEQHLASLYHALADRLEDGGQLEHVARAAALLYRIGVAIHYYDYQEHTQYLITHARINGMSHREILLCASIATYKSKKSARKQIAKHSDLLRKEDLQLIGKLGMLLQLAISLDRSETQSASLQSAEIRGRELLLHIAADSELPVEDRQLQALREDFQKEWKLTPVLLNHSSRH